MSASSTKAIQEAAEWIVDADGLLITAGASMGIDSDLPDLGRSEGFWPAYAPLFAAGIRFEDIASAEMFRLDSKLAWGFHASRLKLCRATEPHEGFRILKNWADEKRHGAFVLTSNVDGQFQKAGYAEERVCEVRGSIHHLQCLNACWDNVWRADRFDPEVDERYGELISDEPRCPRCGSIARPNVLMFGDHDWIAARTEAQRLRLDAWSRDVRRPVVIEIGAGTTIPTVRRFTERLDANCIRINTEDPEVRGQLGLGVAGGGLSLLRRLAKVIDRGLRRSTSDIGSIRTAAMGGAPISAFDR